MRLLARKTRLLPRGGFAFGLGGASLALIAACSSESGEPGAQGGASATGGTPGSGGVHTGGSGGLPPGSGGSATPGSGGLASGGAIATGGQSSAGTAGLATGGVAGNSGAAGSGQGGAASGGQPASGGAASGGAASGGAASGGLGGNTMGGKSAGGGGQTGAAGASQGGSAGKGGTSQGGSAGKGGASQGGSAGSGGAAQGGSAGKGGASQGGAGQGGAGGKGGGGAGGASGCKGGKVVHFVYFVESDQTYSESQRTDIEKQAFKFQEYWFGQLGATFYLAEPVVEVIRADHPAKWYMDTASGVQNDARWWRLDNVMAEVHRKLGIRTNDPNRRLVNYPIARFDGHVGASDGGAWMDGDDLSCMPNNGATYPYPPPSDSPATCLGHVAHEFGHVLGLDHEGPQDGCMIYGFYQPLGGPMCNFGSANVAKIKAASSNTGWLNARPGQTCAL